MSHFCIASAYLGWNACEGQQALTLLEKNFTNHISEFGLSYGTKEEFQFRFEVYQKNDEHIQRINAMPENTYTVGHNFMSTFTDDEYKSMHTGYNGPQSFDDGVLPSKDEEEKVKKMEDDDVSFFLPKKVDWIAEGAVNAVKNQGRCGSCWAFSATVVTEGQYAIKHQRGLPILSEQQLVDCDLKSAGCNGGWQEYALQYAAVNGQSTECNYQYTAKDGTCHYVRAEDYAVQVDQIHTVWPYFRYFLKKAITQGPVAVTIDAASREFQLYKSGVFNCHTCFKQLNHAVAATGYVSSGFFNQYYNVRNSWGSGWGDAGYIKVAAQFAGKGVIGIQQVSVWATVL